MKFQRQKGEKVDLVRVESKFEEAHIRVRFFLPVEPTAL